MATAALDPGPARADFFPHTQFAVRDLAVPKFTRALDVRGGNAKPVRAVAWSCDGRRVATGTEARGLRVWDGASPDAGSSVALPAASRPSPHGGNVAALAWSPVDPDVLVSGCKGGAGAGVVAVWDVTAPAAPVATFHPPGDVLHVAFHPSGRQFAVVCPRATRDDVYFYWLVSRDGKDVWAARDDVVIGGAGVDPGIEEVNALRFSHSGRRLLAVSNDGGLHAWAFPVEARAPLPDLSASGAGDGPAASAEPASEPARATATAAPSREGSAGRDGPEDGGDGKDVGEGTDGAAEGEEAEGHGEGEAADGGVKEDAGAAAQSDAGGAGEVSAETEGAAADGDVEMGGDKPDPAAASSAATPLASTDTAASSPRPPVPAPVDVASADAAGARQAEAEAARARAEHELAVRRHRQLARVRRHPCGAASLLSLSLDPLGRFLAVGGQDAMLSVLDTRDWISHQTFDVTTAAIRHSAFSPDGELIAIAGDDSAITIVALHAGTTLARLPVAAPVNALAWSPRTNTLAWSTSSKAGIVWHLARQE